MVVVDDISVINAKNANPEPRTLLNSRNLHKNEVEKTKQMNDECILCTSRIKYKGNRIEYKREDDRRLPYES